LSEVLQRQIHAGQSAIQENPFVLDLLSKLKGCLILYDCEVIGWLLLLIVCITTYS
jgi:hypothetical protein